MDLKELGQRSSTCWAQPATELGGSHWNLVTGQRGGAGARAGAEAAPALYRALHAAMRAGEVRAATT